MKFFPGLHQPSDAKHFTRACISVNRLRSRKSFQVNDWIMDSAAFSELLIHGQWRSRVEDYAAEILRWSGTGRLLAAVSQDYMCESVILKKTGLTVPEHQRLTIERYDALRQCDTGGVYVMPVLQGYETDEYLCHLAQYGNRIKQGAWIGVGSVCKRNSRPEDILTILLAITSERPDLKIHAFGVKVMALENEQIKSLLFSADSMAWSFAARYEGRNANDWREAAAYSLKIDATAVLNG